MKRFLAVFLCLCMLIPVLPVFAADEIIMHRSEAETKGTWSASATLLN